MAVGETLDAEGALAAAAATRKFADAGDLPSLLAAADRAFARLLQGDATIDVERGERLLYSGGHPVESAELSPEASSGLTGTPNAGAAPCTGVLVAAQADGTACRVWVQFPRPRLVTASELAMADLIGSAFTLASDRLLAERRSAEREENLRRAITSHEAIGQAVGILMERHRLTPVEAFERLSVASQTRNVKLRIIAARVVEAGLEPEDA